MRFRSLSLIKYGAFTNYKIVFRPDARLHLVVGANEAGKSTVLAAVRALLFGIPERTQFDFEHRTTELRLGGEISAHDGRTVEFFRRKGRKRVLSNAKGEPLADDALAAFLGGLTEDVFVRAFGLDADGLRKGHGELLSNGGASGASLMAAASGLSGLSRIHSQLESEANEIFAAKARGRLINQALERYDDAEKRRRNGELGASKWNRLNEEMEAVAAQRVGIDDQRRVVRTRLARLERLRTLKPLVTRIDAQADRLRDLGPMPDLPAGAGSALQGALDTRARTQEQWTQAEQLHQLARAEHSEITVNAQLLERSDEITSLSQRINSYRDWRRDLPRVESELNGFQADLRVKAAALGTQDVSSLAGLQPSEANLVRVKTLLQSGEKIAAHGDALARAKADEKEGLQKLKQARSSQPDLVDPAPLAERLASYGDIVLRSDRRKDDAAQHAIALKSLHEEANRLSPTVPDIDSFAALPIPGLETIAKHRRAIGSTEQTLAEARREIAAREREIASLETRIASASSGRPLASPERIQAQRNVRAAAWAAMKAALFHEADAPDVSSIPTLVIRFETAMLIADQLADDAAWDAERIALYAHSQSALAEARRHFSMVTNESVIADAAHRQQIETWQGLWEASQINPTSPETMVEWHNRLSHLLQRREKLVAKAHLIDVERTELTQLESPLAILASQAGLPPLEGLDPSRTALRIADRIKSLTAPWDRARGDQRLIDDAENRITELQRKQEAQKADHAVWALEWAEALRPLNLREDASLEEARVVLALWGETPSLLKQEENWKSRIDGIRREMSAFEAAAKSVLAVLGPDLLGLPPAEAIEKLHERSVSAHQTAVLQNAASRRVDESGAAASHASEGHRAAHAAVLTVTEKMAEPQNLSQLAAQLVQRDETVKEIDRLQRQFIEQSDGQSEESLRPELQALALDSVEADRKALLDEEAELDRQADQVSGSKQRLESQRQLFESNVVAEVAAQQRQNAAVELQELKHRWLVLKTASDLLAQALERHRKLRQNPLLQRASELFGVLTVGAFSGIEEEYGDDDKPRLVGRRANGDAIAVKAREASGDDRSPLSTGTLDQLYLALRLAYIEDYCSRSEPAPFIADDLFTSFDDARTEHGIEALAQLSASTQMLLFTHHEHVADAARRRLGDRLDLIRLDCS